jgi:hypothetical protein
VPCTACPIPCPIPCHVACASMNSHMDPRHKKKKKTSFPGHGNKSLAKLVKSRLTATTGLMRVQDPKVNRHGASPRVPPRRNKGGWLATATDSGQPWSTGRLTPAPRVKSASFTSFAWLIGKTPASASKLHASWKTVRLVQLGANSGP